MRKFLVVGCGGSGGKTLRFLMDQLSADLRAHGITELPSAWQFVHIDVPTAAERGPGNLRSVPDQGGIYRSVSTPGGAYTLAANSVEQRLLAQGALRNLLGWAPAPKESASTIPVTNGAGQYRAIGRMLTLTALDNVQSALTTAWERLRATDSWGELPLVVRGNYSTNLSVVPIVIGSMAGGSGASMFLDVCRLMGRLPGLARNDLGVFLFTADVFGELNQQERAGIEGNATGVLGEIVAAQSRAADPSDDALLQALGLPAEVTSEPAFARVFPIGASIGGDGAKFGDGTQTGVCRGLARALAATIGSEEASEQYLKAKIENPAPVPVQLENFAWGTDTAVLPWGSFGYASLSLGRDRYATYATQRVARLAVDKLRFGHENRASNLPSTEQLTGLLGSQWPTILDRLRFPRPGSSVKGWFETVALPTHVREAEARSAVSDAVEALNREAPAQAGAWVSTIQARLPYFQQGAADRLREAAALWANNWFTSLEQSVIEEFVVDLGQSGLPYARAVVERLRDQLTPVIDELRRASASGMGQPLAMDPEVHNRVVALKKTSIGPGHAVADLIAKGYARSAERALLLEAARLAVGILESFSSDVLDGLSHAADNALRDLEREASNSAAQAGLAQLETTVYAEWPEDTDRVPVRFDHADNEVLLTTSADFPAQFTADVLTSESRAQGVYTTARDLVVQQVVVGRWETTSGERADSQIVQTQVNWRPAILPRDPVTGASAPPSQPSYALRLTSQDLLDRARAFLSRPGQPFEQFSEQTISEYLSDPRVPQSERESRADVFVSKFQRTLELARPLVGVSKPMIQALHSDALRYEYTFSAVPLAPEQPVAGRIADLLSRAGDAIEERTAERFREALNDTSSARRIAIFGSYPKYSPLVYSSLLDQLQKRWSAAPEEAWPGLWRWKRTRPLLAGTAMAATEQRALVAGWFLGRMLGLVSLPEDRRDSGPAQVWDFDQQTWLSFPQRLLTPQSRFGPHDWLPAVLESHTLAVIDCNNDVLLTPLHPYRALRSIYDNTSQGPRSSFADPVALERLSTWLGDGRWPSGQPSPVLEEGLATVTADERSNAALKWLTAVREHFVDTYLTTGAGLGQAGRPRARIDTVAQLNAAPMFAQIAELTVEVLDEIVALVERAQPSRPGGMSGGGPKI